MNRPSMYMATVVVGALAFIINAFGYAVPTFQASTAAEATQVAAVATMAAAQATIAAQISDGITFTTLSGESASTIVEQANSGSETKKIETAGTPQTAEPTSFKDSQVVYWSGLEPNDIKPGEPIFTETFDNGLQLGWILEDERWSLVDGALTFTHVGSDKESSAIAFLPILVNGDYQLTLDIHWPQEFHYVTGNYNGNWVFVRVGEMRGLHPFFQKTIYEDQISYFRFSIQDALHNSYDDQIFLTKQFDGKFTDLESTRKHYAAGALIPGTHHYNFTVQGHDYIVSKNGESIISHYERKIDEETLPKALYLSLGFTLTSFRDSELNELIPLPSFDNIEVHLLDNQSQ